MAAGAPRGNHGPVAQRACWSRLGFVNPAQTALGHRGRHRIRPLCPGLNLRHDGIDGRPVRQAMGDEPVAELAEFVRLAAEIPQRRGRPAAAGDRVALGAREAGLQQESSLVAGIARTAPLAS
jgi:hypothetical protein